MICSSVNWRTISVMAFCSSVLSSKETATAMGFGTSCSLWLQDTAMSLDDRIQAYLRATAPEGREIVELRGLTATFNREDPLRYRNYAIPGEPPWDIGALVDAARARSRLPRLEFVASCFPGLPEELEAAGFACEARLDLMTCTEPVALPAPEDVTLELVAGDAPRDVVRELLRATRGAFEEAGEPSETDVERYGGGGLLARVDRTPAGGGFFTTPRH